jgi:hypothetical protein
MRSFATRIVLLCLVGCSEPKSDAPQKLYDGGDWQVVPVQGSPFEDDGEYYWSAWRINTKTGDIEFCTFDSGDPNPKRTNTHPNAGGITCSSESQPR